MRALSYCLFAVAASGCANTASDFSSTTQAETSYTGEGHLYSPWGGVRLNGERLNGVRLNGERLNGERLNGVRLNGERLNGVRLNGTLFGAVNGAGQSEGGYGFIGAIFDGVLADGSTVPLRVDNIELAPAQPADPSGHRSGAATDTSDVYLYTVAYSLDGQNWLPLCGTDASGAWNWAIPLAGTWNEDQGVAGGGSHTDDATLFTFACREGALAKCVETGYKPWRTVRSCGTHGCATVSMAPWHQACTRMMRADYCGNGTPYTVDGTPINVYDDIGVQSDTLAWDFEAEWGEGGALCMDEVRVQSLGVTPSCMAQLAASGCGNKSHFRTGTLLMDEIRPDFPSDRR